MSWPDVDDEKQSVDLDHRSRSRTADRRSSDQRSPPAPALGAEVINYRSASGTSVHSNGSISIGSDLRARAQHDVRRDPDKRGRAEEDAELLLAAEASSSSSNPTAPKDKGKARVSKMADVYVSAAIC